MAHHPAALALAQAELDAQDSAAPATGGAAPELPWLDASLKEALRLYPTVPVLPMRRLLAPVALGRWTLPAGCLVRISPWVLQRDARHWPEPQAFRPERFMPGAAPVPPGAWMPFGAGPRACIGRALAMQEMAGVASALLRQVTPQPLPGAVLPAPEFKVVLRPPAAVALFLVPRRLSGRAPAPDNRASQAGKETRMSNTARSRTANSQPLSRSETASLARRRPRRARAWLAGLTLGLRLALPALAAPPSDDLVLVQAWAAPGPRWASAPARRAGGWAASAVPRPAPRSCARCSASCAGWWSAGPARGSTAAAPTCPAR